jgi:3-oxoadipate enol-lactonase
MPTPPLSEPTYARTVRGTGPGLLLAHGANGSIALHYGAILDRLAAGHTVVGADYPGAGATPRSTTPLDADEVADQLVAAADREGLSTFAILGFSLGGPVAVRAAVRHPDRVTTLALTAPFPKADARLRMITSVWRNLYQAGDPNPVAEFLSLMAFSGRMLDNLSDEQTRATIQRVAQALPPGTPEHIDLIENIDVTKDLPQITAPTLVIITTDDRFIAPALQRQVATGIPHAKTVELNTGHARERPDEWLNTIATFLASQR